MAVAALGTRALGTTVTPLTIVREKRKDIDFTLPETRMTDRISRTTRRRVLARIAAITLVPSSVVFAQAYPAKPVRWIVPYPAGGGSDFLARTVGAQMEQQLASHLS